jgi:hypothetical protein
MHTTDEQPIVIVGNSRSGTTLLRLMLTCHRNICIPPEGPFIVLLEPKYGQIRYFEDDTIRSVVEDLLQVTKMDQWNLDYDSLLERLKGGPRDSYSAIVDGVYREYMSSIGAVKKRWGDKSGSYTINRLASIKRSLPNTFLLHLVRDGRDVACSYQALQGVQGKYAPRLPTDPLEIAYEWKHNLNRIDRFLREWPLEQQTEVRYEDLVTAPASTLQRLCARLGEDYDPEMLDFNRRNVERVLEPKVYLAWKQKTLEEVSASRVGRWKTELSQAEVYLIETLAGEVLGRYGYDLSDACNRQSLRLRLILQVGLFRLRKTLVRMVSFARH